MSLTVEVSGFGLCQSVNPYSVMVICVQQESFQAWTVYRRYQGFVELAEQLRAMHPTVAAVPAFNADDLSIDNLDRCRTALDDWLQSVSANPLILRTQSMYQVRRSDQEAINDNSRRYLHRHRRLKRSLPLSPPLFHPRQFLCLDANMPPPYLEIHWRNNSTGSYDEMEMDDMFEKHLDGEVGPHVLSRDPASPQRLTLSCPPGGRRGRPRGPRWCR